MLTWVCLCHSHSYFFVITLDKVIRTIMAIRLESWIKIPLRRHYAIIIRLWAFKFRIHIISGRYGETGRCAISPFEVTRRNVREEMLTEGSPNDQQINIFMARKAFSLKPVILLSHFCKKLPDNFRKDFIVVVT